MRQEIARIEVLIGGKWHPMVMSVELTSVTVAAKEADLLLRRNPWIEAVRVVSNEQD